MAAGRLTGFVSYAVLEREVTARPLVQRRVEIVRKLLAGEPVDQAELDGLGYQLHAFWHLGVIATDDDASDVLSRLRIGLGCKLLWVPSDDGVIWGWLGGQHELAVCGLECLLSANANAICWLVSVDRVGGLRAGVRHSGKPAMRSSPRYASQRSSCDTPIAPVRGRGAE
jgi:hypothetical protein